MQGKVSTWLAAHTVVQGNCPGHGHMNAAHMHTISCAVRQSTWCYRFQTAVRAVGLAATHTHLAHNSHILLPTHTSQKDAVAQTRTLRRYVDSFAVT